MKQFKKILLYLLLFLAVLAVLVAIQDVDPLQKKPDGPPLAFPDTLAGESYDLDSLKALIGENKTLPPGFEVAGAIALTAFPELKDVHIDMILTPGGAPMESTVDIASLFGRRKNRRYCVLLNDSRNTWADPILLRALPFDAQVGILAHELGHIVYYRDLNVFAFGKWGLKYLFDDEFRARHERSTDLMPVYYGLGSQIYQYAYFIRNDPSCARLYHDAKGFLDKYYLTDAQLREALADQSKAVKLVE